MPTLNWIGKEAVINHHKEVPFRLLDCDPTLSVGEPNGNLLIEGDNLSWWYCNRENDDFYLQGWWGRFYPDFVARTRSGICLALEYKGEHLATAEDAKRKEKLGKIWEEVSYGQCRFWMVTAQNMDAAINEIAKL